MFEFEIEIELRKYSNPQLVEKPSNSGLTFIFKKKRKETVGVSALIVSYRRFYALGKIRAGHAQ